MYKATENISEEIKKGDTVPDSLGGLYMTMYDKPPVELVEDKAVKEDTAVLGREEEKPKKGHGKRRGSSASSDSSPTEPWMDDYLNRGKWVVCCSIKKDALSKSQIITLISLEKESKNRGRVLKALNKKLEEV